MATPELLQSCGQTPGDEDYESDILEDSSSDEGDHNSKTHDVQDYDDEEYGNFLQSVFCNDDGAKSNFSLTDEEDEEEYRPQHLDSNDDEDYDDDDDDGDDDGLIKVARRELEDLVDGCWQTVAGEPLQYASSDFESLGIHKGRGLKRNRRSYVTDGDSLSGQEQRVTGDLSADDITIRPSKLPSLHPNRMNPPPLRVQGQQSGGQSLISNLVRQIFSGEKPSAVCLDGMPVDAIRKLVARQMSMASQLLVQMLLSSEDRSGCFSSCYTSLMELSNHREHALKKAALLQMNMKNLKVAALQKIAQLSQQPSLGIDSSPAEMRLTRAVAERQSKAQGLCVRSTSLFDVPMLADITELFGAIDLSKREIKAQIALLSIVPPVPTLRHFNTDRTSVAAAASTIAADDLFRSRSYSLIALKTQMQRIASPNSSQPLSTLTKMRVWECLIPTPYSPLGKDLMAGTDPSSLMGRSLFTPAEDDLLLRGIIKYGEDSWGLIRQKFLPSKEEQLLQFRFRQMTSPAAKEASKFKRYTALEKSCRGRERWTHEEDLDLLRGYQIYGDKWPLISIFFFPHRCRRDLKARWQAIQKHWERAFSGNLDHITFKTELSASSKMLLHFLKESSDSGNNASTSPMRSAAILQYQSVDFPGPDAESTGTAARDRGDKDYYRDEDAVEEDMLADSDEEDGQKDLDWHLGRLTRRQSVLSQWSRSLSSTAAIYCGGKRPSASSSTSSSSSTRYAIQVQDKGQDKGHMRQRQPPQSKAVAGSGRQVQGSSRVQMAATTPANFQLSATSHTLPSPHLQQQHTQQQSQWQCQDMCQQRTQLQDQLLERSRSADILISTVDLTDSRAVGSHDTADCREIIVSSASAPLQKQNTSPGPLPEILPMDNYSIDFADSQCEFTNFSNITMILDNARALMNGHKDNNNDSTDKSVRNTGGLDDDIVHQPLCPSPLDKNDSRGRLQPQLTPYGDFSAGAHSKQGGSIIIQASNSGGGISKSARPGAARGLFAAVMGETNNGRV